jgi:hypothetical protein
MAWGGAVRRGILRLACGAFVISCAAAPAVAAEIVIAAGEFDVEESFGDGPFEVGVAVRLSEVELWRPRWGVLVPAFGAMANEDEAVYGWGGFALHIPLGERWRLTPALAAGLYERGDSKNLGGTLEFRSGLDVAYRTSERVAVGAEFYHLSNAGIHELNPGTNSLVLTVAFSP